MTYPNNNYRRVEMILASFCRINWHTNHTPIDSLIRYQRPSTCLLYYTVQCLDIIVFAWFLQQIFGKKISNIVFVFKGIQSSDFCNMLKFKDCVWRKWHKRKNNYNWLFQKCNLLPNPTKLQLDRYQTLQWKSCTVWL